MPHAYQHGITSLIAAQLDDKVNDAFFKVPAAKRSRGTEKEFFGEEGEKKAKRPASDEKKSQQKSVDTAVLAEVAKTPILSKYLGAQFSLSRGQFPDPTGRCVKLSKVC